MTENDVEEAAIVHYVFSSVYGHKTPWDELDSGYRNERVAEMRTVFTELGWLK